MAIFQHLPVLEIFHNTQGPSANSFCSKRDKWDTHASNSITGKSGDTASRGIRVLQDRGLLAEMSLRREMVHIGLQEENEYF